MSRGLLEMWEAGEDKNLSYFLSPAGRSGCLSRKKKLKLKLLLTAYSGYIYDHLFIPTWLIIFQIKYSLPAWEGPRLYMHLSQDRRETDCTVRS